MATDDNPIKNCWHCKGYFDGNFGIKALQIICPYCKKPQSSVFEKKSQREIVRKSKAGIRKSKAEFKKSIIQKKDTKIKKKDIKINTAKNAATHNFAKNNSRRSKGLMPGSVRGSPARGSR